jgi:hypothetical protein
VAVKNPEPRTQNPELTSENRELRTVEIREIRVLIENLKPRTPNRQLRPHLNYKNIFNAS